MVAPPSPPRARAPSPEAGTNPAQTSATTTTSSKIIMRFANGNGFQFPADKPLYTAHGKWAWANGFNILSGDKGIPLGVGLEGRVYLKAGVIDDKQVLYISKRTSCWDSYRMFFASLYLNASSKYLRPLQGDCVPWVIGVHHCLGGCVGVAQDLPHPTGWREADMFLEESQKEAIIGAYQKLHDRGVLHGDAEYRHMLIGDDGKVTIIDFGLSSVLYADDWAHKAGLDGCSKKCLRTEMRKVKFLLDWKDSRETEFRLAKLRSAREERDRATADAILKAKPDPWEDVDIPEEPLSAEEKENPDGGLRLSDLNQWSYGDKWVAHHYAVEQHAYKARLTMEEIPRPPISARKTTQATNFDVSVTPATAEPASVSAHAPAIQLPSTLSVGTTDSPTQTVSSHEKRPLDNEPEKKPEQTVHEKGTRKREELVVLRNGKDGKPYLPITTFPVDESVEKKLQLVLEENRDHKRAEIVGYRNGDDGKIYLPMRMRLVEKEPEGKPDKAVQESDTPQREEAMPSRTGINGETYVSERMRPVEVELEKEKVEKNSDPEHAMAVPLGHSNAGESDMPTRGGTLGDPPVQKNEKEKKDDNVIPSKATPLKLGSLDDSSLTARKRSLEEQEELEELEINGMDQTVAALRRDKADHSEPSRKRQKTFEEPNTPNLSIGAYIPELLDSDSSSTPLSDSRNSAKGYITPSDSDDTIKIPLLDDDAADPTPYELNPEACAFLRAEAARGLARFTTANTRVQPLERELDQENHNLEKRRSELLRIILMLPREDRTTLWTNMGQPDARTLLGLLPETPGPSQAMRNLIRVQDHLARTEAESQAKNSNGTSVPSRETDPGFLAVQNAQAKTGSKMKLRERLEIERKKSILAMPPPSPPVSTSPRNASQGGSSAPESSPSTSQGPTRSGPTVFATHLMDPCYDGLRKALDDISKAHPNGNITVTIPKEVLAREAKSTRKYTIREGPSSSSPGRAIVRTPAFHNTAPLECTMLKGALEMMEAKRKREATDSDDSKAMADDNGEQPDAKRRKTSNCDLL